MNIEHSSWLIWTAFSIHLPMSSSSPILRMHSSIDRETVSLENVITFKRKICWHTQLFFVHIEWIKSGSALPLWMWVCSMFTRNECNTSMKNSFDEHFAFIFNSTLACEMGSFFFVFSKVTHTQKIAYMHKKPWLQNSIRMNSLGYKLREMKKRTKWALVFHIIWRLITFFEMNIRFRLFNKNKKSF